MASTLPLYHVDAFTTTAFSGNPAAVCLVSSKLRTLTEDEMQKIGAEMNLSETSFLISAGGSESFKTGCRFGLRWFTPTTEVNLCGHATLASAAVLFHKIGNQSPAITFETKSGLLVIRRTDKLIAMDFPLNMPHPQDKEEMKRLLDVTVGDTPVQDLQFSPTTKKLLVRLGDNVSRSDLESLRPQIARMQESEGTGKVRGVILTLRGTPANGAVDSKGREYDFISRYFAPWVGIPEDPVTGSAHTVLAGYWAGQLGKTDMYARQCSTRGGDVHVHVEGERVHLAGEARVIMEGTLHI